jgi:hypothetical protein
MFVHYMLARSMCETRHTCTADRHGLPVDREPRLKCIIAYSPAPNCSKYSQRVLSSAWHLLLLFHSRLCAASSEEGAVLDTRRRKHLPQIMSDVHWQ